MKHPSTKTVFLLAAIALPGILFSCHQSRDYEEDLVLWYQHPARSWEEALPLGNGRLGAMVFGNTSHERIQLNDDSMWPANTGWDEPDGGPRDLGEIRTLLLNGDNSAADAMFVEKFSRKSIIRSHQTMGDLFIDFDHHNITEYRRELNISKAIFTASYKADGKQVREKVFVSHPHQAIIVELSSEAIEGISGRVRLSRPEDDGHPTVRVESTDDGLLTMKGMVTQRKGLFDSKPSPILEGVAFETCLKINHEGGAVVRGPGYLELRNVKKAVLIIVSNSSFYHNDYPGKNHEDLAKINGRDIDQLEKDHTADYEELFSRVRLQLGDVTLDTIPTDERIAGIRNGHSDPGLEALLFQYGRYLLISSSRPGTNPANLQGLWNQHIEAPWNADYHLNVNLQMNYWLANSTGLDELNLPLFDYIDKLIENGKMTALKNYGCNGSFIPHATDLWAPTWLRAPTAYWGCSVGAGGWLMQHYWYHFEYTLDTNFLRHRVYPALHEVARFYSDWLMEDPRDGTLVSAPSTSPENRFFNAGGEAVATCMGSAIDQQIISEVFSHYLDACEIIGIDNDFVSKLRQQKAQLRPGFVMGSDGRILEWDREYAEPEPGHRHMSHLYGFHPGTAISQEKTPEFFEAVRKTLDYRLAHGGAGTGWSRAWLINCSARLLDGEMAYKNIQLFFERSVMDNLFDSHPPFQIDGNFGYTAGIAEMLLQTHENGILRILPALPVSWPDGFVEGLRGRGGMIINIYWSNSTLQKVIIRPSYDLDLDMIYNGRKIHLELKRGIDFVYEPKED